MKKQPNKSFAQKATEIQLPKPALVAVVDGVNSSKKEIVLHLMKHYDIIYESFEVEVLPTRLSLHQLKYFLFSAVEITFKSRLNFKKESFSKQEMVLISDFLNNLAKRKMIPHELHKFSLKNGKFKFHHKNESLKLKFGNVDPLWKRIKDKKKAKEAKAQKQAQPQGNKAKKPSAKKPNPPKPNANKPQAQAINKKPVDK